MARARKRGRSESDAHRTSAAPDAGGHDGDDAQVGVAADLEEDGHDAPDAHGSAADSFQARLAAWRQQAAGNEDAIRLRLIGRAYEDLQRDRIRMGNRFFAYGSLFEALGISPPGDEAKTWRDYFREQTKPILGLEAALAGEMLRYATAAAPSAWAFIEATKGIGPRIGGRIIGEMLTAKRFANPAKLWAYAGMHVVDGHAPKRKRGQKSNWNPRLRMLCYLAAQQFVKQGERYRTLYDERKAYERARQAMTGAQTGDARPPAEEARHRPGDIHMPNAGHDDAGQAVYDAQYELAGQARHGKDDAHVKDARQESGEGQRDNNAHHGLALSPLHIHNRACRFAVKRFLVDLWEAWRR